jgi:hypothetical protein
MHQSSKGLQATANVHSSKQRFTTLLHHFLHHFYTTFYTTFTPLFNYFLHHFYTNQILCGRFARRSVFGKKDADGHRIVRRLSDSDDASDEDVRPSSSKQPKIVKKDFVEPVKVRFFSIFSPFLC